MTFQKNLQHDFPKKKGGRRCQRPFGTFLKIHPFWRQHPSLIVNHMIDTQKCYFNYERAARFGKIQQWLCLCQKRAMTSVSGKSGLNGRDELLIWLGQKYPSHKGFNLFFFSKSPLHHWYRFFLKNAIWYFWSILDFLYFCLYVLLSFYLSFFCLSFFLSFHVFVFLSLRVFVFLSFVLLSFYLSFQKTAFSNWSRADLL